MVRKRVAAAWAGLVVLMLGGLFSIYFLFFSLWMLAYPKADPVFWRPIFYQRLTITGLIGVLWIVLCLWLFRQGKARE
jgi:predicted Abi (CAAX) family protease